jgi:hypothetical protein
MIKDEQLYVPFKTHQQQIAELEQGKEFAWGLVKMNNETMQAQLDEITELEAENKRLREAYMEQREALLSVASCSDRTIEGDVLVFASVMEQVNAALAAYKQAQGK